MRLPVIQAHLPGESEPSCAQSRAREQAARSLLRALPSPLPRAAPLRSRLGRQPVGPWKAGSWRSQQSVWVGLCHLALLMLLLKVTVCSGQRLVSTWPEGYSVRQDREAGRLVLSTRYYAVQHDLKRGGVIAGIRLTHGRASNLLASPIVTRVCRADGTVCTDDGDPEAKVTHRREDLAPMRHLSFRITEIGRAHV